ncbi:MAG: hypothetical protein Q4G23_04435, partial [Clostridia bacterium]|nr:hypothetical protein [Clostridia bacterium]
MTKKGLEIKGGCDKIVLLKVSPGAFVQCSGTPGCHKISTKGVVYMKKALALLLTLAMLAT